jgi:rRNA maturation endonuclease Nob1
MFVFAILALLIVGIPYYGKAIDYDYYEKNKPKPTKYRYDGKLSRYEEFMANYDNIMESLEKKAKIDEVEDEEIKEFFPNETRESILLKLFDIFIEVQYAWMEFDYDKLRKLCSDELCNTYIAQLDALKLKNGKNIMHDFKLEVSDITGLKEQDGIVFLDCFLKASFFDYIINVKTGKVIRGDKDYIFHNMYRLQFIIEKNISEDKCPNCGAVIKDVTSGKCEYCGSDYVVKPKDFVLNKKEIIK